MSWIVFSCLFLCMVFSYTISEENTMKSFGTNLSKISWAHAVNSKKLLEDALNSEIMMLEADIILGELMNDTKKEQLPVMGHPPATKSDLSLDMFLSTVLLFNDHNKNNTKGVKLDFKSIEVFEKSISIIENLYAKMSYPVWINADIISGPVNASTIPVNPERFLKNAKIFSKSILSIGWTTNYGPDFAPAIYTEEQIQEMLDTIKQNGVSQTITFPVRAGIAAESDLEMKKLLKGVPNSTLTIWSSVGDAVNVEKLRNLIRNAGLDKVYIDVPEDLRNKLHLDNVPNK